VKDRIYDLFSSDPNHVKTVFLLGHVPVPYSGEINPDVILIIWEHGLPMGIMGI
jgi:hypothetical protein